MVSVPELCRIVESGFYPLSCECTVNFDGSLRIKVFEPDTGRIYMLLTNVSPAQLTHVRDISNLIGELRTEMRAGRRAFASGL
ncbi:MULTISPECIES: DUF1652 domain-containing protein [unclassified Pseudomonas]|uniref:DUF1652 domain-containing protein n=1 Tax=unclassified Pseudomonas TaxID=196821 RepID=UPI002AC90D62|nr:MULTISPECIES: DUF1652 domain-containing protein [unclassified Pseudomonas]MEB0048502.1 DUF1652 domain-containing protein [Pseudomonas sp. Dout3]MEB0099365.1 DUF1652 domain-containing protein [Pseudomonas sp. DC1.2]WPX61179.1 DUF1652 domain-containing protein [Pseudomonas sp. DC1.2]